MKIFRDLVLVVVLSLVLVSVASPSALARVPAEDFPQLVWQVWLNQSVDVVAPAYNLDCWDVPAFHSEEVPAFLGQSVIAPPASDVSAPSVPQLHAGPTLAASP